MLKRFFWFILGGALAIAGAAAADVALTAGSGTTIFTFTCFTTKNCPPHVNINSAGTEVGTSGSPLYFDTPASGNLYSAVTGPIPTQSATVSIGGVGLVNGGATGSTGSATPSSAVLLGYSSGGNLTAWDKSVTVSAGTNRVGYTSDDPCTQKTKTNKAFTTNGTSSVELVAVSGSTTIYVCSISMIAAGATTVAFTTGTGTACATNNAAVIGSTTANIANSMSLPANGGWTLGNGTGTIAAGASSSAFCMVNGTNVYVSGNITYVQQ